MVSPFSVISTWWTGGRALPFMPKRMIWPPMPAVSMQAGSRLPTASPTMSAPLGRSSGVGLAAPAARRLDERRQLRRRSLVERVDGTRRRLHVRGEGAVAEDAQRRELEAVGRPPGAARGAGAALGIGVHGHALAHPDVADRAADRRHVADELVAHDRARRGRVAPRRVEGLR